MFNLVREREGFTLIELVIAVSLLGIVVIAVAGIDLASRRSLSSANRRARVQDEARYAMEHMVRNIRLANEINTTLDPYTLQVRIDIGSSTRGPNNSPGDFTDDTWIVYRFVQPSATENLLVYYPDAPDMSWTPWPPTIAYEVLTDRIVATAATPIFTIDPTVFPTFLTIDLTTREDPFSLPDPVSNPEITLHAGANLRCKSKD